MLYVYNRRIQGTPEEHMIGTQYDNMVEHRDFFIPAAECPMAQSLAWAAVSYNLAGTIIAIDVLPALGDTQDGVAGTVLGWNITRDTTRGHGKIKVQLVGTRPATEPAMTPVWQSVMSPFYILESWFTDANYPTPAGGSSLADIIAQLQDALDQLGDFEQAVEDAQRYAEEAALGWRNVHFWLHDDGHLYMNYEPQDSDTDLEPAEPPEDMAPEL